MAVIVPAVVSFFAAGGAAGIAAAGAAVAAGTAGLAAYATLATVAGGFLATIGGLTKNQKLAKFGGYLSLAGGVGQIAGSLMGAGSAAAGEVAKEGAEAIADGAAADVATEGAASLFDASSAVGEQAAGQATNAAGSAGSALGPPGEMLAAGGQQAGSAMSVEALNQPSLIDQARMVKTPALDMGFGTTGLTAPAGSPVSMPLTGSENALAGMAAQIQNPSHLKSLLDNGNALNKVGGFLKNNKELATIGGDLLKGGMGVYARQAEWDDQMSLMDARRRRLNQPIRLGQMVAPAVQPLPIGG